MKASRVHHFGPPEVIAIEEVPQPAPGPGEVLVEVKAAGVGPWDALIRSGKSVVPQPLPLTLGADLAGVVVAVGEGVFAFEPGDEVFGVTNARFTGAYAEYAVASAGMLADKPLELGHVEAASLPVVAVTAWQMLYELAQVERGQTVLVLGAGGNVGACIVQLAHRLGAHVVAAVHAKDVERVRRLGADRAIDVDAVRLEDAAGPVVAVLDTVGGDLQSRSLGLLEHGGVLVSAASQPDRREADRRGVRASFFLVEVTSARLGEIAGRVEAGTLAPDVGAVLPLADAARAHEMLDGARPKPVGRIVLAVGDA